jgi:Bacterial aa3 type cytochrome c oxidase subunit IV
LGKDPIKAAEWSQWPLSAAGLGDRDRGQTFTAHTRGTQMAGGNDYKAHNATYSGFIGLVKWGAILTILVTAFTVYMIAK